MDIIRVSNLTGPAWIINFQHMCNTLCENDSSRKDKSYVKI